MLPQWQDPLGVNGRTPAAARHSAGASVGWNAEAMMVHQPRCALRACGQPNSDGSYSEVGCFSGTATFRAPGRRVGSKRHRRQLPERRRLTHPSSVAHRAQRSPAARRLFQQISYVLQSGIGACESIRELALSTQPMAGLHQRHSHPPAASFRCAAHQTGERTQRHQIARRMIEGLAGQWLWNLRARSSCLGVI